MANRKKSVNKKSNQKVNSTKKKVVKKSTVKKSTSPKVKSTTPKKKSTTPKVKENSKSKVSKEEVVNKEVKKKKITKTETVKENIKPIKDNKPVKKTKTKPVKEKVKDNKDIVEKVEEKKVIKEEIQEKIEEVIVPEIENIPKIKKIHYKLKLIIITIFITLIYILYNYPYGTTIYASSASKKNITVPKMMKLSEECCSYSAIFYGPRSYSSLKKEMNNILSNYEIIDCDGKKYYYNREEDYTIIDYSIEDEKIFNKVYITYGKGNSCAVNTNFRKIELLPDNFTIEEAIKDGNLVILENRIKNKDTYSKFKDSVNKKIPTTLRMVTLKNASVIVTDLEYMANGKFKVIYDGTRDKISNELSIVANIYEKIGVKDNKLYAYNGEEIEKGYYLFDEIK